MVKKYLLGLLIIAVLTGAIVGAYRVSQRILNLKQSGQANTSTETTKVTQGGQTSVSTEISKAPQGMSAVNRASAQGVARQDVSRRANEVGVNCLWLSVSECEEVIARIKRNTHLANALQYAKSQDVLVYPTNDRSSQGDGYISIDIRASDKDIIKFLTDENAPQK